MYSCKLPIDTYGLSVTGFELFSWRQKRFRPLARPSDSDTMTYTALEATPSSSGKNYLVRSPLPLCLSSLVKPEVSYSEIGKNFKSGKFKLL